MTRTVLELIGWVSSGLIVLSLAQARVLRFRWMNLGGAVLAVGYNTVLGIWPFAAMNAVIAAIDAYWIARLRRERHDPTAYSVVEVRPTDAYLGHVIGVHLRDIRAFQPSYAPPTDDDRRRWAFLVQRDAETVGAVVVRDAGDGNGVVELDYVTPRFRDFTPGEFVYERSGVFAAHGLRRLVAEPELALQTSYLGKVGFRDEAGEMVRELVPTAA